MTKPHLSKERACIIGCRDSRQKTTLGLDGSVQAPFNSRFQPFDRIETLS